MAETVKKSRIVSEDDLEETLMEEFNLRLKSCLSQDPLETEQKHQEEENLYENIETVRTTSETFSTKKINHTFIETEKREQIESKVLIENGRHEISNRHSVSTMEENIYENVQSISKISSDYMDMERKVEERNGSKTEEIYEDVQSANHTETEVNEDMSSVRPKPSFTLFSATSIDTSENPDVKSVKDRMFLSSDDTSTLLFTQTVTSPMLTPSEENVDFLKGFRRESSTNTSPKDSSHSEESPKTNGQSDSTPGKEEAFIIQDGDSEIIGDIEEEVVMPSPEKFEKEVVEDIYANLETMDELIYENVDDLKKTAVTHCSNKLEGGTENSACLDDSEPISEDVPEIVSQIELHKTPELVDEDDVTDISDVCSLDKQVSDSDSSNLILDNSRGDELGFNRRNSDKFGVIQDFIDSERIEECVSRGESEGVDAVESNEVDFGGHNVGYNDSEVMEYIAMTEEPKTRPNVFGSVENSPKKDNHVESPIKVNECGDFDEVHDKNMDDYEDSTPELKSPTQTRIVDEIVKSYVTTKTDALLKNREKDTETVPAKIVQNLTSQFMKNGDEEEICCVKNKKHDANQLKSVDIMKQINKFEQKEEIPCDSTQITESYVETSTFDSNMGEKAIKKKKSKKSRKEEKENISVNETNLESFYNVNVKNLKSSFSKFDALQKKNVLHIRSSDSTKAQEKFNGTAIDTTNCKCCGKQVFQMEQIKAEKAIWHKNCFRCHECSKQLNVDTYESHEGNLYCKPHFKALFAPKVVDDTEEPPSDKPDLGLEELQSLNVKERFQVFEHHQSSDSTMEKTQINVKRSPSILSKLAKFQSKGMDIGVADDSLNGIPIEESSSEEEEEEEIPEGEDPDLVRAKRVQKEKPFHFTGMSDVKNKWEHGESDGRDERREEREQEIQSIRNKLFMGKQGKMKEAYQEAVMKSESSINLKKEEIKVCDTKTIKERFEKGEVIHETIKDGKDEDEQEIYESEISKKSRSLFLQLDANASKAPQMSPVTPKLEVKKAREAYIQKSASQDTVKSSEQMDDVTVQTADIQQRFKFFETYREPEKQRKQFRITPPREGQVKGSTPERELYHDPDVVRAEETVEDSVVAKESHTATKMLNKFRQMEENMSKEPAPQGPKPLKRFTPPPEPSKEDESSSEEGSESEEEVEQVDNSKMPDEDLIEAQKAARAKQLRAKFEKWEAQEIKKEQNNSSINIMEEYGEEQSQIESTKLLRARFESMRETHSEVNKQPRVKVNRFVEISNIMENCEGCEKRVYPLEKISVHGHLFHKSCFKCKECSTILRMDSYTYNQGRLYCTPHFKRLFITKGNYDSAFGLDGHKEKWNSTIA